MQYRISLTLLLLSFVVVTATHPRAVERQSSASNIEDIEITMKTDCSHSGCPLPIESENEISCCPAYSISIAGDGTVTYVGVSGVRVKGKQIYSLPAGQVRELIEEFHKANFFSLEERYRFKKLDGGGMETISHAVATTISITLGGKTKSVYNFYGAPEALDQLQRKIYETSQVAQFVGRT